jgi:hypothetical protein
MKKLPTGDYEGATKVFSRDGRLIGDVTGGFRQCQLFGCGGTRVGVRWKDGKVTFPCSEGMKFRKDGQWQIM